jgi:hypothetical protein
MSIDTILHDIAIYHLLEVSCITDITVALSWERRENAKSYTSKLPEQTSMGPLSLGGHPVPISMHSKPWPRRWRVCRDWCAVHPRESARDWAKLRLKEIAGSVYWSYCWNANTILQFDLHRQFTLVFYRKFSCIAKVPHGSLHQQASSIAYRFPGRQNT